MNTNNMNFQNIQKEILYQNKIKNFEYFNHNNFQQNFPNHNNQYQLIQNSLNGKYFINF